MLNYLKTKCTKPEQSNPTSPFPAATYGVPKCNMPNSMILSAMLVLRIGSISTSGSSTFTVSFLTISVAIAIAGFRYACLRYTKAAINKQVAAMVQSMLLFFDRDIGVRLG